MYIVYVVDDDNEYKNSDDEDNKYKYDNSMNKLVSCASMFPRSKFVKINFSCRKVSVSGNKYTYYIINICCYLILLVMVRVHFFDIFI